MLERSPQTIFPCMHHWIISTLQHNAIYLLHPFHKCPIISTAERGRQDFWFSSSTRNIIMPEFVLNLWKLKYKNSVKICFQWSALIMRNSKQYQINYYTKKFTDSSVDVVFTRELWWEHPKNNFRFYQLPQKRVKLTFLLNIDAKRGFQFCSLPNIEGEIVIWPIYTYSLHPLNTPLVRYTYKSPSHEHQDLWGFWQCKIRLAKFVLLFQNLIENYQI